MWRCWLQLCWSALRQVANFLLLVVYSVDDKHEQARLSAASQPALLAWCAWGHSSGVALPMNSVGWGGRDGENPKA